jgi:hypothetical protein
MIMSTLEPDELAAMLSREKLVLIPYAEYQSLLDQAKTLQDIRDRLRASGGEQLAPSGLTTLWDEWRVQMGAWIDARPDLSTDDRRDLTEQVSKIQAEAAKGDQVDPSRLEKLINTLAVIGPDVFEVAVTTLANPLAGLGLALKKIGDRAKLERMA